MSQTKAIEFFQKARLTYSKHCRSQPSQVEPSDSTNVKSDQLFPIENQGNPIQDQGPQKLALLDGEDVPLLGLPSVGSGDMNVDGPSPIDWVENFGAKLWRLTTWDPTKQSRPKCALREIMYGGPNMLLDMFPFCCERAAQYQPDWRFVGDEQQRRESFKGRRVGCEECKFSSSYSHHDP